MVIDSTLGSYVDVAPTNHIMARLSWLQAFVMASVVSTVCAGLAETYPMSEVLDWEIDSQMQLSVTSDGDLLPILYAVIPLTADLGLNESQTDRGVSEVVFSLFGLELVLPFPRHHHAAPAWWNPLLTCCSFRESISKEGSFWLMRPPTPASVETTSFRICAATR